MRSDQREAILVVLYRLEPHLPSLYRVAGFAVRAELAAVNVRMTVRALGTDVREDKAGVALLTGDIHVHAAQRIACLIVVELGN